MSQSLILTDVYVVPLQTYYTMSCQPQLISRPRSSQRTFQRSSTGVLSSGWCWLRLGHLRCAELTCLSCHDGFESRPFFFLNFNLMTSQKVILPYSPLSNESEKKTNIKTLSDGQHVFPQLTDNEPSGP